MKKVLSDNADRGSRDILQMTVNKSELTLIKQGASTNIASTDLGEYPLNKQTPYGLQSPIIQYNSKFLHLELHHHTPLPQVLAHSSSYIDL